MTEPPTGCGLYAVLEAGDGAGERLAAALAAAELAAVLIAPAPGRNLGAEEAKPLLQRLRRAGITALILDDVELARTLAADGVHLGARDDPRRPIGQRARRWAMTEWWASRPASRAMRPWCWPRPGRTTWGSARRRT